MRPAIQWKDNAVLMIDQRKLPVEEVYLTCRNYQEVAEAIERMAIRGAPAIGVAAAFGVALGVGEIQDEKNKGKELRRILTRLWKTRPTARNLFWALERMKSVFEKNRKRSLAELTKIMVLEALAIELEDIAANRRIGAFGQELVRKGQTILTHCNAGALATAGYGTALGVIRAAHEKGKAVTVYVDETRPFLQGARLTCWELNQAGIPVVLITDNMAGWMMKEGRIDLVITGADRVARNGDTANKIGTYSLAVLAREHRIPFYIAAPLNTVDFSLKDGSGIPIEERDPEEVRTAGDCRLTLPGVKVRNPAFDVTPARFISAIITEKGIARPPFGKSLLRLQSAKPGK